MQAVTTTLAPSCCHVQLHPLTLARQADCNAAPDLMPTGNCMHTSVNTSKARLVAIHRSQDSQAMAERITDEVNSILSQEPGGETLSKQAVLDLIDQGASQGGPEAHPNIPLYSC